MKGEGEACLGFAVGEENAVESSSSRFTILSPSCGAGQH